MHVFKHNKIRHTAYFLWIKKFGSCVEHCTIETRVYLLTSKWTTTGRTVDSIGSGGAAETRSRPTRSSSSAPSHFGRGRSAWQQASRQRWDNDYYGCQRNEESHQWPRHEISYIQEFEKIREYFPHPCEQKFFCIDWWIRNFHHRPYASEISSEECCKLLKWGVERNQLSTIMMTTPHMIIHYTTINNKFYWPVHSGCTKLKCSVY